MMAEDHTSVPEGPVESVVIAAPIPDVNPDFFKRFSGCKCTYVVGTPGGVNCPMPSWKNIVAGLHEMAPVLYLTPHLTRTVRFPRQYVMTNVEWNETIKHTVWDAALTFMARRPETAISFGNWGFVLRLNFANAGFCREWFRDVEGKEVDEVPKPDHVVKIVQAYVDRNSGWDRQLGAVIEEMRQTGTKVDINPKDLDATGKPATQGVKDQIRRLYRECLFEQVYACVLCTDTLIFSRPENKKLTVDEAGFEKVVPCCGYTNPDTSLGELFGTEEAIGILKTLPLRRLTPAYDVVGMICADQALEDDTGVDGGLGLKIADADDTMGLGMLTEAQRKLSKHPILMTLPQSGEGVYAVGPFG